MKPASLILLLSFLSTGGVAKETVEIDEPPKNPQEWVEKQSKKREMSPEEFKRFSSDADWFIPPGLRVTAELEEEIYSFNVLAPAYITLTQPARCPKNGNVVLPKGTLLLGDVAIVKTREDVKEKGRANIEIHSAILPNGKSYDIQAIVLSPDGSAGVIGHMTEYQERELASALLLGSVKGVASQLTFGSANINPIIGGAAAEGLNTGTDIVADEASKSVKFSVRVTRRSPCKIAMRAGLILDENPTKRWPSKPLTTQTKTLP